MRPIKVISNKYLPLTWQELFIGLTVGWIRLIIFMSMMVAGDVIMRYYRWRGDTVPDVLDPVNRRLVRSNDFNNAIRRFSKFALTLIGYRTIQVEDLRQPCQRSETTGIFVAPHTHFFDMFIIALIQPMTFVSRSVSMSIPILGTFFESFGVISVDRSDPNSRNNALNAVSKASEQRAVLIYPEGTTSKNGEILQFNKGVFGLQKSITPICIDNNSGNDLLALGYDDETVHEIGEPFFWNFIRCFCQPHTLSLKVTILSPNEINENETAEMFALRVRNRIASYLHYTPVNYLYRSRHKST